MYIHYSTGNNSGPRTLVRIVEVSVIGGVHFRRFHCSNCGYYLRTAFISLRAPDCAAAIRGRRLFEEIWYIQKVQCMCSFLTSMHSQVLM